MRQDVIALPALALYVFLLGLPLFGQVTTATISGTVRDVSGAVVPGAEIVIRNVESGISRTVPTDSQGRYTAPNLSLGRYELRAGAAGFQTEVRTGIGLTVGQHAVLDFSLRPGAVAESVTVTGDAPLVETATSSVGALVDRKQIGELPLNGRNYTQLVLLQPGVIQYREQQQNLTYGRGVKMSIGGARPSQVGWRLNGLDIANQMGNTPGSATGSNLGVDAIQEFQVLTNNFSAEHGKAAGGVVNIVLKSGTNEFHGSVFEYLRNDNLDARAFFDPVKPPLARNQFGFSLGGPIRRDRTFFFGSYEGLRQRTKVTQISNVPTREAKQGILTVGGVPTTIPIAPAVRPYLALYPDPNGRTSPAGIGEWVQTLTQAPGENYFVVKGDHTFSDADSVSGSYVYNKGLVSGRTPGDIITLAQSGRPISDDGNRSRTQYISLHETHIFSPTTLHTFRAGFNRSNISDFSYPTDFWPQNLYFVPGLPPGPGGIEVSGLHHLKANDTTNRSFYQSFEVGDTLHLTRGAHAIKLGMEAMRLRYVTGGSGSGRGRGGRYVFNSLPDFLQGRANQFEGQDPDAAGEPGDAFQNLFGFFVQDDARVTSRWTINAGLRYEFITKPHLNRPVAANLVHLTDPQLTISDQCIGKNPSLKNFGPRVGFAWDVFGNQKTAVRGGLGFYYDQITSYYMRGCHGSNPELNRSRVLRNPPFPNAFELIRQGTVPAQANLTGSVQYDIDQPYRIQHNFGIQHELLPNTVLVLNYVGARAIHSTQIYININNRIPTRRADGRLYFDPAAPKLNPNFGTVYHRTFGGDSYYHALQAMVSRRMSAGFQLQGSYTWSKSLDTGDIFVFQREGFSAASLQNPWEPGSERGLSTFDARHNFVLNTMYDLPFGQGGSGVVRALGAGWQLGGILTLATGHPFSAVVGFDQARKLDRSSGDDQRPDLVPGRSNNPVNQGNIEQYFDPTAFSLPEAGTLGNAGRGTMIGPGMASTDLTIKKRFRFTESKLLEFRSDFFNLFNRANFRVPDLPNRTLFTVAAARNPIAGRITGVVGTGRQMQFSLRLEF